MAINDTVITIRGWAGADPTIYHNDRGNEQLGNHSSAANVSAVVNVGVTARHYNRQTGQYYDGETAWYSVRTFGRLAENVAVCVHKGTPVLVRGKLTSRSFQGRDGMTKTSQVIIADALGIEISAGTASYVRALGGTSSHPSEMKPADSAAEINAFAALTSDLSDADDAFRLSDDASLQRFAEEKSVMQIKAEKNYRGRKELIDA